MNKKSDSTIYILAIFVAILVIAGAFIYSNNYVPKPTEYVLSDEMLELAENLEDLYPYILDEGRFYHPANKAAIRSAIHSLKVSFAKVPMHSYDKSPSFHISYTLLMQQLEAAEAAFLKNNLIYSRNILNSVSATCSSCHKQDKKFSEKIMQINRNIFTTKFELADFYYVTRHYKEAMELYNDFVLTTSAMERTQKVQLAITRQLSFYLTIEQNITKAIELLQGYLDYVQMPEFLIIEIKQWLSGLHAAQKVFLPIKDRELNFVELQYLISAYFKDEDQVPATFVVSKIDEMFYYVLSGYIYDYLDTKATPEEVPELLYWLGVCERALNYRYGNSFADLYLKQCVLGYPKHPMAKKCYKEYKEYITLSYSGSGGINLPEEVAEELSYLGSLVTEQSNN